MNKLWREALVVGGLFLFSLFFLISYKHFVSSPYLEFSDAAKVGDIARNLLINGQLAKSFTFFSATPDYSIQGIPILNPLVTFLSFKILGVNDFAVISPSMVFYILSALTIYFLGKKVSGSLVGILSAVVFITNTDILTYAVNGASESLFIFEILLATLLVTFNKKGTIFLTLPLLTAMYFTRPQAFIFIGCLILYWLILKFGFKKAFVLVAVLGSLFLVFDRLVLYPLSYKTNLYSVTSRGEQAILYYPTDGATSDGLRGGATTKLTYIELGKKVFYNSYNFYKLLPQIASPYLIALFVLGLFFWKKDKLNSMLKLIVLFTFMISILVASLTIPLIRYIHPAVPLIYLFATDMLAVIFAKTRFSTWVLISIIFLFAIGQTLGVIFLDSRYDVKKDDASYHNLALFLKANTNSSDVILTNLDTWGSWYGERKTIWFPLTYDMALKTPDNFNAIYLTNYKMDDANYKMGDTWKAIFLNPQLLEPKYKLEAIYENNGDRGVLLVDKSK